MSYKVFEFEPSTTKLRKLAAEKLVENILIKANRKALIETDFIGLMGGFDDLEELDPYLEAFRLSEIELCGRRAGLDKRQS